MILERILTVGNHGTKKEIEDLRDLLIKNEEVRQTLKKEFIEAGRPLVVEKCLKDKIMSTQKEYSWIFVS